MNGNYIVIEGLEGSGKTTTTNIVANILKELGIKNIVFTREPGGTQFSEQLRNLILDSEFSNNEKIHDKTELLMLYAARVQLVETVIKPALVNGEWVIGDRHNLSTKAYQGGGRGIDQEIILTLSNLFLGNFRPKLTLYLDVTPEVSLKRIRSKRKLDRIEKESLKFFRRVRKRYLDLAKLDDTIFIINSMQPLDVMYNIIRKIIVYQFWKKI